MIRTFPEDVKDDLGAALLAAQRGEKHADAKPLKDFGGANTLQIVENHDGDTYRAVYTVKFKDKVPPLPEEVEAGPRNTATRH